MWIESSVTNEQKHDKLPLYTLNNAVSKPVLAKLQLKDNFVTFEVDTGVVVSITVYAKTFEGELSWFINNKHYVWKTFGVSRFKLYTRLYYTDFRLTHAYG